MTERPILFSAPMVRAILDGSKTQTRRIVKERPQESFSQNFIKGTRTSYGWTWSAKGKDTLWKCPSPEMISRCPQGQPGDQLWVRETWCELVEEHRDQRHVRQAAYRAFVGKDSGEGEAIRQAYLDLGYPYKWRPGIHMFRWASRIQLEVTEVRVQRLQEISEEDAKAEGVASIPHNDDQGMAVYRPAFRTLWDSINGKTPGKAWADNPWVWAITFKRIKP